MDIYEQLNTLTYELHTVNAERFGLQTRVAELEAENARLSAELFAITQWSVQAIANARAQDAVAETDYLAYPKFLVDQAVTAISDLWAQVPSVRFEWVADEARRRTSRLGPSAI